MKNVNSKNKATDYTLTAQKIQTWMNYIKDGANSNENPKPLLGNTELCEH